MFGIAITQGVYYYWYEFVKARFEQQATSKRAISTLESILAGAIAGAATTISTNPIWVVNVMDFIIRDMYSLYVCKFLKWMYFLFHLDSSNGERLR